MKNSSAKLLACYYIIGCLLLLIITKIVDSFWPSGNFTFYRNIVLIILPTIASILGVSAVWELKEKQSFAREILNLNKISDNVINSGIVYIFDNFKSIIWDEELGNTKNLTTFFTYAYTFANQNRESLMRFISQPDNKWTAILPDFRNSQLVEELDIRFCYGKYSTCNEESVYNRIQHSIHEIKKMGATIKLYNGTICSTYYLMDHYCIFTPLKHGTKKRSVPAFKVKEEGTFYKYCQEDIQAIINESEDYYEEAGNRNEE